MEAAFIGGGRRACYRLPMLVIAGSVNMDLVAPVPQIPGPGQTVLGSRLGRFHGGKGANQAVAAARLGAEVRFFGAVGRDAFGDELVAGLRAENINTGEVLRVNEGSGCALICVDHHGENAIAVLPGANALAPLPPPDLKGELLLLQLEVPLATNVAWAQAAAAHAIPVMLNAAPMVELPRELLAAVQVLVVNEGELAAMVGPEFDLRHDTPDGQHAALDAALAHAAAQGPQRVVVTLGERGCRAWDEGRVIAWPAVQVPVVDTTGCGDAFVGALAASLAEGLQFDAALKRATVAAGLSCRLPGARAGMPRKGQLATAMST